MEKTEGLNRLLKRHLGDSDSSDDEDESCPGISCDPTIVLGLDCTCCLPVMCSLFCEFGFVLNPNGCATCNCLHDPDFPDLPDPDFPAP